MSGFGGRNSRELSACNKGKLRVVEKFKGGADGLIRSIGGGSISLWLDSKDINNADGNLTSWSPKEGTEPSQSTEDKKPNFNSGGWIDNGPCVEFDHVGESMPTTTAINLGSVEKISVFGTVVVIGSQASRHSIWEYSAAFNTDRGFAIGFDTSNQPWVGLGTEGGYNYITSNTSYLNEAFCIGSVADRAGDLVGEVALYINGILEDDFVRGGGSANQPVNFADGAGSWMGVRNDGDTGGDVRPLNGKVREFIVLEGVETGEFQTWLMSKALNYKAKIT